MGGFGVQSNKSNQQSQQESFSGLRGTQYSGEQAGRANDASRAAHDFTNRMMSSPNAMMGYGRQMLPGGQYGLGENVDAAVQQLGRFMFGQASGDMAARGMVSPENQAGVVGSAITQSLPQFIPQLMQFQQQQFMAPQSLWNMAQQNAGAQSQNLGSQGSASSSGSSRGFGFNMWGSPTGGGGNSGGE